MAGIPWTKREKDILVKMAEMGRTAKEISTVLRSRSVNSISCQAAGIGLSLCQKEVDIDMDAYARLLKGGTKCL